MENLPRNLEKDIDSLHLSEPAKRSMHWTFMLVGDNGQMLSVRRFKELCIIFVFLLVCLAGAAGSLFFLYGNVMKQNEILKKALDISQEQILSLRNERDSLAARLVPAESKTEVRQAKTRKKPVEKPPVASVPAKPFVISVEDFVISYESNTNALNVKFKLVKSDPEAPLLSGHTFVILKHDDVDHRKWLVIPPVKLVSGRPSHAEKGQRFSIARFKTVEFKTEGRGDLKHLKKATIFVYSETGGLILEKTIPIKAEMLSAPVE